MGTDKRALRYRGDEPHVRFTARLLEGCCDRVFISCREDQEADPLFRELPVIVDAFPGWGPLGGILSAQRLHPHAAFLVTACDLPFLGEEALARLLERRDAAKMATAFLNPERDRPEPLCAIYEPSFAEAALRKAEQDCLCPTEMLRTLDTRLIPMPEGNFLENANSPEDRARALSALAGEGRTPMFEDGPSITITVEYFALFRACARKPSETLEIAAGHGASVYEELRGRYGFPMPKENVHLAVNDEYAPWETPLRQGDRVVFIPPVSGG